MRRCQDGAARLLRSASAAKGHGQHPKARAVETPGRTPKNGKIRPAADKGFGPAERAWHVMKRTPTAWSRCVSRTPSLVTCDQSTIGRVCSSGVLNAMTAASNAGGLLRNVLSPKGRFGG